MKKPTKSPKTREGSSLRRMVRELREFAKDCARCAECMEREIRDGICIRQSAESKQARADVLRSHERWALETLKLSNAESSPSCGAAADGHQEPPPTRRTH